MRRIILSKMILASLAIVFFAMTVGAQPPKVTAVRAARMIDVKTGNVIRNAVVLISNNRIDDAGENLRIPAGSNVIDLGDATLLPGLIDCHTHLLQNYKPRYGGDDPNMILTVTALGTTRRALLGVAMGRQMLEAGFTTVRDVGNSGLNGDVALRDAIQAGWVVGPRIFASTRALSAAGGQFGGVSAETQKIIEQEYVVISGVEEARRAVRQAFYDGADQIKVIVNTDARVISLDEMKVVVSEAHRVGKKVAAHAIGEQATRIAAEAGVDSIEHAYIVPDDVLAIMASKKIYLVPTDYPAEFYASIFPPPPGASPERIKALEESFNEFAAGNRSRLQRAIKAGVRVAAGSDEYYDAPDRSRGESAKLMFRAYASAGMSPLQIIQAATINAADLLDGQEAMFGNIEKGKFADMIAVSGDPLQNITELEKIVFVMKNGDVIVSKK
jgi:imidazolonepropionase-like amidohydrolase